MQKGFATLEIIFVVLIISLLASATIPNVVRVVDRVALDYETKKLYTDLKFLQSFDRMAHMQDSHFDDVFHPTAFDSLINLVISPEKYIFKKNSGVKTYGEHKFSYGVTASKKDDKENWEIKFDDFGRVSPAESNHIILTSRFGENFFIFNSVGRFRGSHTLPANEEDY